MGTGPDATSNIDTGWHTSPFEVTLVATDTLSGPESIRYRIAGGAVTTYSVPFTISAQGATSLSYWATDAVGNVGTTTTATVSIDSVGPATISDNDGLWHSDAVDVGSSPPI